MDKTSEKRNKGERQRETEEKRENKRKIVLTKCSASTVQALGFIK